MSITLLKKSSIFYGWYMVLACTLIIGASVGLFHNSFVVFVVPVPDSLGFSRGAFTSYTTVQAIAVTIATPLYSYFFKRLGQRNVMLVAAIICCGVQFAFSFSSHLWQFYALAVAHGFFVVGIEIMSVGTLINSWFVAKKGIAMGIAYTGSGIVAGIMVPALTKIIEDFGWQMGYRAIGLCALALLLPMIIFIVRDKPQDIGLLPLGVQENGCSELQESMPTLNEGVMRADALKNSVFWLFSLATLLTAVITMGIALHSAAFLTDIGYTARYASVVVSIFMFVTVAGKLIFGVIFDKLGLSVGAFLTGFVCLLSSVLLLFSNVHGIPFVFALAFGFAFATQTVSLTLLTSQLFGNRDFSSIYGLIMMILMFGAAIGSPLPAFIFDVTGSYVPAWILFAVLSIISTVSLMMASALSRKLKKCWTE
jgi:MFS family permease